MSCDFLHILTGEETGNKASNAYSANKIYILEHRAWTPNEIAPSNSAQVTSAFHCTPALGKSITHKLTASLAILMVARSTLKELCNFLNKWSDKPHFKESNFKAVSTERIFLARFYRYMYPKDRMKNTQLHKEKHCNEQNKSSNLCRLMLTFYIIDYLNRLITSG